MANSLEHLLQCYGSGSQYKLTIAPFAVFSDTDFEHGKMLLILESKSEW